MIKPKAIDHEQILFYNFVSLARVVKLVDTLALGASERKLLSVRVRPWAPHFAPSELRVARPSQIAKTSKLCSSSKKCVPRKFAEVGQVGNLPPERKISTLFLVIIVILWLSQKN